MPLQASGQISFSNIATELALASSDLSLRSMSSTAGKTVPDSMSEFYGFAVSPPTLSTATELQLFSPNYTINQSYSQTTFTLRVVASSTIPITQRGFVYSYTTSTPTITNGTIVVMGNNDSFQTVSPINFFYGRTAYIRAFATNSKGTTYGAVSGLGNYLPTFNTNWWSYWNYAPYGSGTAFYTEYGVDGFVYGSNSQVLRGTISLAMPNTGWDGFTPECRIDTGGGYVGYPCSFDGTNLSFTITKGVHGPNYFCWSFDYFFLLRANISTFGGAGTSVASSAFIEETQCP
jgi:hypothetical protein